MKGAFWEVEKSLQKGQKGLENHASAPYLGLLGLFESLLMFFGMPGIDHIRELGSSNCAFLHGKENTLIALLLFVIGRPPDFSHTERVLLLCDSALVHGRNEDEVLRCCTGIFFFALLLSFFFTQNWWCGEKKFNLAPQDSNPSLHPHLSGNIPLSHARRC